MAKREDPYKDSVADKRRNRKWPRPFAKDWQTLGGKFPALTEQQIAFIKSEATNKGYGGSFGCGKTVALIVDMMTAGMENPGLEGALFRKEFSSAEKSVIKDLRQYIDALNDEYRFGITLRVEKANARIIFPTGAIIDCFGVKDVSRVQGGNYHRIWLEEATQMSIESLQMIFRTHRGKGFTYKDERFKAKLQIAWTANSAEGWIKDNIIIPYVNGELPPEFEFIPGRLSDLKAHYAELKRETGKDVERDVALAYDPEEFERMAHGTALEQWAHGSGNVYPRLLENSEFHPHDRHVITKAEFEEHFGGPIRPNENCYFGFDHGVDSPCGLLGAVIREVPGKGRFIIIVGEWREPLVYKGVERTERIVVEKILEILSPAPLDRISGWWDCRMKQKMYSKAKTIEERMMDPRLFLQQLGLDGRDLETKDIKTGIRTVRRAINCIRIKYIKETTPLTREEHSRYAKGGPKNPPGEEDLPPKTERKFHLMDGERYLGLGICGSGLLGDELVPVPEGEYGEEITSVEDVKEETLVAMRHLSYSTPPSMVNKSRSMDEMTAPRAPAFPSSLSLRRS